MKKMRTLKLNVKLTLFCLVCFSSIKAQVSNKNIWADYDAYVEQRMQEWNIPGMAIVIVKGDSTMFTNTYGYSDVQNKIKVSSHTLFAIGSCTKYFTVSALSLLADEKKIDFDRPVISYYPQLKLSDSILRNELILKDILSHRTGLERGDYMWYGAKYSKQEVVDRLQYLNKMAPLRDQFIYNNMMYSLAGLVLEKQSGMQYEKFIVKKLLTPLHMLNTVFEISAVTSDYARPYSYTNNMFKQLAQPLTSGIEPAGALWSDIDDMTKWIKFHLRNGKIDSTQFISKSSMARLKTPVVFTGDAMKADESEYKSYGLGMGFSAYKGYRVMYHTGVAGGYTAHIAFLPEQNIGIMILTNTETYTSAMMNNLFDRVLHTEQTDWNSAVLARVKEQWKEDEKSTNEQVDKIRNAAMVVKANEFVGTYKHHFLRNLEIINRSNKLYVKYNSIEYQLLQQKENEFVSYDENVFGDFSIVFNRGVNNKIETVQLEIMGEKLVYKISK
jgi:CubicO group peptidase (beta-lactamase class C family)